MINEHHSTPSCVNVGVNMTAAVLGRTTRRAKILHPRQYPAHRGQPRAHGRADRHGRSHLRRPRALGLRARRRRRDVVGQYQSRAQSRALRGVPRPRAQVLDRSRAVPLGGQALPLPPRQSVVPAAAEAASADLGSGHGEPGDGDLGGAARLHVRAVPGALRHRPRAVRLLSPGRRRSRPHRHAGQPGLPHLRRHRGHAGQGARGGAPLRLAHGADPARADGVHVARRHALARGRISSPCAPGRARSPG